MKTKHFYSHLIQVNDIILDLGDLEMTSEERVHLLALLEANIHTTVVNTVLNELPESEKKIFLQNILIDNHNKTLEHLWKNSADIEQKIKDSVENLLKEMKKDISSVKKSK